MRVALIVDNPYRDLPGIVLLATQLCQQGATCYLVPLNLASRELSALAPDFVLLTSLRKPRQRFAQQLLDAGMQIGVLDAEGGVLPSLEMYAKLTSPDFSLYREVSCFCSWGPKLANYVENEGWYDHTQVVVTGAPRFDFYAQRWRSAALRLSPFAEQWSKPTILINGSFPRANPGFLTPEEERRSWGQLGFDSDYIARHQKTEHQTMIAMAKIANHLANRFPQAAIVYRPHPFERLETYRRLLERRENLHLLKVGTVEGWILRASAVIQHHCTTAIEAGMAGKPALLPDWLPTAQRIESTEAVSIKCRSQSEMDDEIFGILNDTRNPSSKVSRSLERVIGDWFYAIDGRAHERVALAILSHLKNQPLDAINLTKCRKMHYGWNELGRTKRAHVGARIRMGLRLPVTYSLRKFRDLKNVYQRWDQSGKYFDSEGVRALTEAIGPNETAVAVTATQDKRDYRIGYSSGRSVTIRAL
jgi:surface carbohydrate biosynthesis protein